MLISSHLLQSTFLDWNFRILELIFLLWFIFELSLLKSSFTEGQIDLVTAKDRCSQSISILWQDIGSFLTDHVELTGGGVDEKITFRIAAGDGKSELLGRDVAIERLDLKNAHTCRRVLQNRWIIDWNFGQRGVVVPVQHLHVHLHENRLWIIYER